jgi:hypothetical protein
VVIGDRDSIELHLPRAHHKFPRRLISVVRVTRMGVEVCAHPANLCIARR